MKPKEKIKVLHIITGLGLGGAENMLYKLLSNMKSEELYFEIISLTTLGHYGEKLRSMGYTVTELKINFFNIFNTLKKSKVLAKNFDIITTWLYHADFFGFIIGKILLRKKLIWNIRHSNLSIFANKLTTYFLIRFNSLLSKYVDVITYNSFASQNNHFSLNFSQNNSIVIQNGFDLNKMYFDKALREKYRNKFEITDSTSIFITIGRWDIQKGYKYLLKALSLMDRNCDYKLYMVGTNLDQNNILLKKYIKKFNLENKVFLLGKRTDIQEMLCMADIYISSSIGESFSNSIAEAMLTNLHCIVTDVGDSKLIVDGFGEVYKPKDVTKLAKLMNDSLARDYSNRSSNKVNEIMGKFSLNSIVEKYKVLYFSNLNARGFE